MRGAAPKVRTTAGGALVLLTCTRKIALRVAAVAASRDGDTASTRPGSVEKTHAGRKQTTVIESNDSAWTLAVQARTAKWE